MSRQTRGLALAVWLVAGGGLGWAMGLAAVPWWIVAVVVALWWRVARDIAGEGL